MANRTVFLDIDGTLTSVEGEGPFADDIAGIEKSCQRGIKFFLCTGRSLANIPPELAEASWVEGIVAAGGAHVILKGKTLCHNWVPVPVLCEIADLFLAKGKRCSFRGDKLIFAVNQNGNKVVIQSGDDFVKKYPDARVSMLVADLTMGNEERTLLEQYFDIYPQEIHFDCFIKGNGKAKGMQLILDRLSLDRKDSVAIGDSANDLDIFSCAGKSIAVGNACDELKAKASWISAPAGEGGVVKALEYLGFC